MCDTVFPIAEFLVEDADFEHKVVDHQEENAPLDKRHIQSLEALLAEEPGVVDILFAKEISCRYEE